MVTYFAGQLKGGFAAQENLIPKILKNNLDKDYEVFRIGIFSNNPNCYVNIDGNEIFLGITGMLELRNIVISSLFFSQNENSDTAVDYFCRRKDHYDDESVMS